MKFRLVRLEGQSDYNPTGCPPLDLDRHRNEIVIAPDGRVFVVGSYGEFVEIPWLGHIPPLTWVEAVGKAVAEKSEEEKRKLRAEELIKLRERFSVEEVIKLAKEGVI